MPTTWNRVLRYTCALTLLPIAFTATYSRAQNADACPDAKVPSSYQTFFLNHVTDREQFTEIQTVLRNDVQDARINGIPDQSAIAVCGTAAELQLVQKIVADLDRPHKTWRLTFAFVQSENAEHAAPQHVTLVAAASQRTELRQGNRIPVVTGSTNGENTAATQVQYLDVGINIVATIAGDADNLELRAKIEQSGVADEKSGIGAQDPIVHQTVLDVTSKVAAGKSVVLGSLDVPGTTRHEQVEVTVEPAP